MSLENYTRAGQIASKVRENTRKRNHIGRTLYEICNSIEKEIIDNGGHPAFPVNVSINEIAAHYTAEPDDQIVIKDTDVVKIDLGVHIDGYVADTAVTISYDPKYDQLIKVAELSLSEAIKIAKNNTKSSEIGKIIENTISHNGLKPIQNLSGHSLDQYIIHAGKSIPNIRTYGSSFSLSSNQAYAIEPFVTTSDGLGIVYEGKIRNIFSLVSRKPTKDKGADEFIMYLWNQFKTLPFALRWLVSDFAESNARTILDFLIKKKNVRAYPILVEGNNKVVSQAEHTIFIFENKSYIITK
ncbi:MAG: type II methionyl aminopeptidase [Candidatus Nitrosocosmicus sp.]|jgi:methionyl aminopeptidase|uniref:type II methionyl aminopeptidase n=1 Tax=Candidatus Nitrosocosmicus sp. FF01 TaxID=3397670 RepID=UPI002ACD0AB8|nr:type II methionyl aminopeptidase [Candidatus Nitrosocosmicus sp.]